MKLLFLYGPPASGKLTIAQELASLTGYKLFHNHLVVDTLLSVFPFGSPSFVELRETIWLSVFTHAAASGIEGLIFTFAPERTVRPTFIPAVQRALAEANSEVLFIEFTCPLDELRQRLNAPSRQRHGKLTSQSRFDELLAMGTLQLDSMPHPALILDTSQHAPAAAASLIANRLRP
jgi:hypothetical protein